MSKSLEVVNAASDSIKGSQAELLIGLGSALVDVINSNDADSLLQLIAVTAEHDVKAKDLLIHLHKVMSEKA